jgi:hypothetical protein
MIFSRAFRGSYCSFWREIKLSIICINWKKSRVFNGPAMQNIDRPRPTRPSQGYLPRCLSLSPIQPTPPLLLLRTPADTSPFPVSPMSGPFPSIPRPPIRIRSIDTVPTSPRMGRLRPRTTSPHGGPARWRARAPLGRCAALPRGCLTAFLPWPRLFGGAIFTPARVVPATRTKRRRRRDPRIDFVRIVLLGASPRRRVVRWSAAGSPILATAAHRPPPVMVYGWRFSLVARRQGCRGRAGSEGRVQEASTACRSSPQGRPWRPRRRRS